MPISVHVSIRNKNQIISTLNQLKHKHHKFSKNKPILYTKNQLTLASMNVLLTKIYHHDESASIQRKRSRFLSAKHDRSLVSTFRR